jgi:hypothetical protein
VVHRVVRQVDRQRERVRSVPKRLVLDDDEDRSSSPAAGRTVDEAKAWQIEMPVEITFGVAEGFEPSVYIELVTLREGDTVAVLTTQDVLTEFDPALRDKLVQTLADRMPESAT